jgi:hypothetical protein
MKIIMLAGAGSVGKTKLAEACFKMLEEREVSVVTHFSTTRKTYERYGLTKESDALGDPQFNMKFQDAVLCDNADSLSACARSRIADVLITDRSPYDYAAYYFTVFQQYLTLDKIKAKQEICDNYMRSLQQEFGSVHMFPLPFPSHWSIDTESSDGWRSDTTGKNFVWASVLENELIQANARLRNEGISFHLQRLTPFFLNGSPEVRAAGVLSTVFPNL